MGPGPTDHKDQEVINYIHSHLSWWRTGKHLLPMNRQASLFNIPDFPSVVCEHKDLMPSEPASVALPNLVLCDA